MARVPLVLAACRGFIGRRAAQPPDAESIRAAFLKMIARPRVPLAPETQPRTMPGRTERAVQLRTERGERVPGVFIKAAADKDRRPVVIFLHGTGSRKEEFLALMRTFADRGFATAAIDARHHGARIAAKYGSGNEQYFAAMLETYLTGKGRPYLYDTVWDVMRLVDYLETRAGRGSEAHRRHGHLEGGTEAYLAAAVDPRIAAAVPIIGVQGFRWALDNDQWRPRVGTFLPPVEGAARTRCSGRCCLRSPFLRSRRAGHLRRLRRGLDARAHRAPARARHQRRLGRAHAAGRRAGSGRCRALPYIKDGRRRQARPVSPTGRGPRRHAGRRIGDGRLVR